MSKVKGVRNRRVPMPENITIIGHNGKRCDMLVGPCSCGAWHNKGNVVQLAKEKGIYTEAMEDALGLAIKWNLPWPERYKKYAKS